MTSYLIEKLYLNSKHFKIVALNDDMISETCNDSGGENDVILNYKEGGFSFIKIKYFTMIVSMRCTYSLDFIPARKYTIPALFIERSWDTWQVNQKRGKY